MWATLEYRFLLIGNEIDRSGSEEQVAVNSSTMRNDDGLDTCADRSE